MKNESIHIYKQLLEYIMTQKNSTYSRKKGYDKIFSTKTIFY
jgi:hypothetical protein